MDIPQQLANTLGLPVHNIRDGCVLKTRMPQPDYVKKVMQEKFGKLDGMLWRIYSMCDGFTFCGLEIVCMEECLTTYPETGLQCFHNWSNGDHDAVNANSCDGMVVFLRHCAEASYPTNYSIADWFKAIYNEWNRYGDIAHPLEAVTGDHGRVYNSVGTLLQKRGVSW